MASTKTAQKKSRAGGAAKAVPKAKKTPTKASRRGKEQTDVPQRLRIRVRAYEHKILDTSVRQIMDTALRYNAKVVGPIPLPTEISRYTVNRAPFIYKDAREQFEMRVHKRLIEIEDPTPKLIDALTNLSLPTGVSIEVKMM